MLDRPVDRVYSGPLRRPRSSAGARARRLRPALIFVVAHTVAACAGAPPAEAPPPERLAILVSGCTAIDRQGTCEIPEGATIRVWAPTTDDEELLAEPINACTSTSALRVRSTRRVDGGTRLELQLDPELTAVRLTVVGIGRHLRASASLPILFRPLDPALARADELRARGAFAEAREVLSDSLVSDDDVRFARAVAKLARIVARERGFDDADEHFRRSIALSRRTGWVSSAVADQGALARMLMRNGRHLARAALLLEALDAPADLDAETRGFIALYRGHLAYEGGDLRRSLSELREAGQLAARVGTESDIATAHIALGNTLKIAGRPNDALAIFRRVSAMPPAALPPCVRGPLLASSAWAAIFAETPDRTATLEDAVRNARAAAEIFRTECVRKDSEANALGNAAIASMMLDDEPRATTFVAAARAALPGGDPALEWSWLEVEAWIALRRGRAEEALALYERIGQIAERHVLPEALPSAQLGRARTLAALGRTKQALLAYDEAERTETELSLAVPLGEGRESFLQTAARTTADHVEYLVALGRAREAVEVARRGRARLLSTLRSVERVSALTGAERARWDRAMADYRAARAAHDEARRNAWRAPTELAELRAYEGVSSKDLAALLDAALSIVGGAPNVGALAQPAPGELFLVYQPVKGGFLGFSLTSESVAVKRLPELGREVSPDALSRVLLAPFERQLAAAERVRFIAPRELERFDLHALPWHGQPLVAQLPVEYGVDLGDVPRKPELGTPSTRRAVLVCNPQRDLPKTEEEARAVAGALEKKRWQTRVLRRDEATREAVTAALTSTSTELLHFSGHGRFEGRDGFGSALGLAANESLALGEILALPRVPRVVVLSGCDTARTATSGASLEGLGLAQALLVAGAHTVVATTRPVADADAGRFVSQLYETEEIANARALSRAAKEARVSSGDWTAFRVIVR